MPSGSRLGEWQCRALSDGVIAPRLIKISGDAEPKKFRIVFFVARMRKNFKLS